MALNSRNQIAILDTVAEALEPTRSLILPYMILTLVSSLPIKAAEGLGLFDKLYEYCPQV